MPRKFPALVRGRRAEFWFREADALVVVHPNGRDQTEVPLRHLHDAAEFARHVERLRGKRWISHAVLEELLEIQRGVAS